MANPRYKIELGQVRARAGQAALADGVATVARATGLTYHQVRYLKQKAADSTFHAGSRTWLWTDVHELVVAIMAAASVDRLRDVCRREWRRTAPRTLFRRASSSRARAAGLGGSRPLPDAWPIRICAG